MKEVLAEACRTLPCGAAGLVASPTHGVQGEGAEPAAGELAVVRLGGADNTAGAAEAEPEAEEAAGRPATPNEREATPVASGTLAAYHGGTTGGGVEERAAELAGEPLKNPGEASLRFGVPSKWSSSGGFIGEPKICLELLVSRRGVTGTAGLPLGPRTRVFEEAKTPKSEKSSSPG